jgi:hypothetical protein
MKLSEKSRRYPKRGLRGTQTSSFGPFWPRYTGRVHAYSVARTPFSDSFITKFGLPHSPVPEDLTYERP